MKSFFVIKGNPDKWFDQQGQPMRLIDAGKPSEPYMVPLVNSKAEDVQGAEICIDDANEVPHIKLYYHVRICQTEDEVKSYAKNQN